MTPSGLLRVWSQIVVFAALLTLPVRAQTSPLTDEECEAVGKRIALLLESGRGQAVVEMFNFKANFERITDGLELNERNLRFARERHRTITARELTKSVRRFHDARFLRVQWIEGEKSVLIRLQNRTTGEFNYLGCALARDEFDGEIKITDLIDYLLGESCSQTTRTAISALLDVQAQAVAERAPEKLEAHLATLDRIAVANEQIDNRQFNEAQETLNSLPAGWRRQRYVLYLRFIAAQHTDREVSKQVTQDWLETFPGDSSLDLSLSYTEERLMRYDRAIQHIDSLMRRIGKDGSLSLRRAELCLKNDDPEGARLSAREALELEPSLDLAHLIFVKAALRTQDHRSTLFAWRSFTLRFPKTNLQRLVEAEPGFSDFINSTEFREWSAKR